MDLKDQFQKLMKDMEENIKDEEDLKYVQNHIFAMMSDILDKVDNLCNSNEIRIAKLEDKIDRMSKELYLNDVYDIEVVCPYCNYEFETEFDENKKEIKCPECNNIIELDWSSEDDDDGCTGSCNSCPGCGDHHSDDEEDM